MLAVGSVALAVQLAQMFIVPAASAAGPVHSGRSFAVGLTGLSVLDPVVRVPDVTLPEGVVLPSEGGSLDSAAAHLPLPAGLGSVDVAAASVAGSGTQSSARSEVTAVRLLHVLPASLGLADGTALLEAQVLTATAAVGCDGQVSTATSIASLSVLGQPVDVRAHGTVEVRLSPSGPVAAQVTIDNRQTRVGADGTVWAEADAVLVDFPADGPLAAVVQGTIAVAHAEADMEGCTQTVAAAPPGLPETGLAPDPR